jgi:hypothetical protein
VSLAALGRWFHWPRAELEALDDRDAAFWTAAMIAAAEAAKDRETPR